MNHLNRLEQYPRVLPWVVGLVSLTVYIMTMPSGLTWAHYGVDGGELITASFTLGVAHPPGYPLYVVLGKVFSTLPIGSIAYRYNLFSAVSMSTAAVFAGLTIYAKAKSNPTFWGILGGLTFAFGSLVWKQAIIAEVYGLFLAFFAITVWALVIEKKPFWLGLFFGLTFISHTTAVFLLPLILWNVPQQKWGKLIQGALIGFTPLLLLPILAQGNKPVVWEDPSQLQGWWLLITSHIYQGNAFNFGQISIQERAISWGRDWLNHYSVAGFPLVIYGLYKLRRSNQLIEYLIYLGTAVFYFIFAFFYGTGDAIVFSLPAFLLILPLLIEGLKELKQWAIVLPLTLILLHFNAVNINQDRFVHQQLDNLLSELPPNALLETSGEAILFPLWYAKFVELRREDILLFDNQLFTYRWYRDSLTVQDDTLTTVSEDISQFRMQQRTKRPYCNIVSHSEKETAVQMNCEPLIHDQ